MSLVAAAVLATLFTLPAPGPAPPSERLEAIAEDLSAKLSDVSVRDPEGTEVPVADLLDLSRIRRSLATIGEAEGWPAAWLVVQDLGRPWDLVMRVALGADGDVEYPAAIFAATRRTWDHGTFEIAFREALGRKPARERVRNLVVQSFSKQIVTSYVYQLPPTGPGAKGLMALLPEGSLLRESRAIRWSDGSLLTLAIVMVRPRFLPAACDGAAGSPRDHADAGGVVVYLTGEDAVQASIDISDRFRDAEGSDPIVPRYPCIPGDDDPAAAAVDPGRRFAERPLVRLIETSRPDDGSDEIRARIAGLDLGRGRREAALVRIAERADGLGFELSVE